MESQIEGVQGYCETQDRAGQQVVSQRREGTKMITTVSCEAEGIIEFETDISTVIAGRALAVQLGEEQ